MTRRSVVVPSHEHKSFDIKPLGECRSCDNYHERVGVTAEDIETAMLRLDTTVPVARGQLRLLAMLKRVDPAIHAVHLDYIAAGVALADAVNEAMGEWPDSDDDGA